MSDCCSSNSQKKTRLAKLTCPVCHLKSTGVSFKTMLHHIKNPWLGKLNEQQYYFCNTPTCNVVYHSEQGAVIDKLEVRTVIGTKEQNENALICYCFGVSKNDAAINNDAREFVIKQTKESVCSCDTANPSGKCCLKDFPR